MPDESHLDNRYFVDDHVYNCPFCNRRNVKYSVVFCEHFDWTADKKCHLYIVLCSSCFNRSMHLAHESSHVERSIGSMSHQGYRFKKPRGDGLLDDVFFYSVPTSFFVLDDRIPKLLRGLLTEAEGSLKGNFLTGASACARKIVYELAQLEGAEEEDN